jgi:hypothetical protein
MPKLYQRRLENVLDEKWEMYQNAANDCLEVEASKGRYMSTAFLARDMLQIVKRLGEDGMLRFWGKDRGDRAVSLADLTRKLVWHDPWDDLCSNVSGPR